jgi:hypothetical protein
MGDPDFDQAKAHRYFSAYCFNRTWTLISKAQRTPDEDEAMIRLSQASLWHWTQRDDCTRSNMAIGYWQLSRVCAIAGRPEEARRYGHLCGAEAPPDSPFLLGYAREALARAEKVAGNYELTAKYRAEAAQFAERVTESEDRALLVKDLETI